VHLQTTRNLSLLFIVIFRVAPRIFSLGSSPSVFQERDSLLEESISGFMKYKAGFEQVKTWTERDSLLEESISEAMKYKAGFE
jgi:hypothetical protein